MSQTTDTPPPAPAYYKVLMEGHSFNNYSDRMEWSLPVASPISDGAWLPGDWHAVEGDLHVCRRGLHLTTAPKEWFKPGATVYLAEFDDPDVLLPERAAERVENDKICVRRARLLRPLGEVDALTQHCCIPESVCPIIAAFVSRWWDDLGGSEDREARRAELLGDILLRLIGTRGTDAIADRRAWMVVDWHARVATPAWLRVAGITHPELIPHAEALEELAEIVDRASARAAQDTLDSARRAAAAASAAARAAASAAARDAARDAASAAAWAAARAAASDAARAAARDAARDAAWDAASAAAWDAARDAAWDAAWAAASDAARAAASAAARDAAWAAARDAAWDAARDAARDAASDAASDAAWDAASDAAWDAISPAISPLQESAVALLRRMIEAGGEEASEAARVARQQLLPESPENLAKGAPK